MSRYLVSVRHLLCLIRCRRLDGRNGLVINFLPLSFFFSPPIFLVFDLVHAFPFPSSLFKSPSSSFCFSFVARCNPCSTRIFLLLILQSTPTFIFASFISSLLHQSRLVYRTLWYSGFPVLCRLLGCITANHASTASISTHARCGWIKEKPQISAFLLLIENKQANSD